jgi:ribose transport system ATP-binding protein
MAEPAAAPPVLQMLGISKRFPGTEALHEVDLEIERPLIHGLVGQNGAGKSTLLKILAGEYGPSEGEVRINGEEVDIANPRRAHDLGIGIVYQEFSLLPNLSVAHNVSLGQEPMNGLRIDERALFAQAREALARIGAEAIPAESKVADLPLSERQLVEIAKVLILRRPRILIFDEPTAALGQTDVSRLFRIMRGLRDEGVTVIFVSHRYREVLEVCEAITVLRNGRVVERLDRGDATLERLVDLTLGQKAETVFSREHHGAHSDEVVLEAKELTVGSKVKGVDLRIRRGEIVGVCGLLGSGQNELARALGGDAADVDGSLSVGGKEVKLRSPRQALRLGIALISESRQEEGLFLDMRVAGNISIASLQKILSARALPVMSRRKERRLTREAAGAVGIPSPSVARLVRVLSGGNQQKALLGRWLMRRCDLLVMIEPTRGVDVGAKLEIYRQVERIAQEGTAVVVVSTDVPEVMGLADRLITLYEGRVTAEFDPRVATEQRISLAMQGAPLDAAAPEPVGAAG